MTEQLSGADLIYEGAPLGPTSPARLVVISNVYHQPQGEQPVQCSFQCEQTLISSEQPFIRRATVGPEWTPIDFGWLDVDGLSYLVIENVTEVTDRKSPSPGNRIEIGVACARSPADMEPSYLPLLEVLPGQAPCQCRPSGTQLYWRCTAGKGRANLYAFPL